MTLDRRVGLAALLVGALAAAPGCETYERRPLRTDAVRTAWLTREASDATVAAYAAALADAEGRGDATPAFDAADGLSLAEAEAVALVFNPDLRVARLEAGVSQASADHAGRWQDPVLGVDLERLIAGAGGQGAWVAASTLAITLPISGRLEAEQARARAGLAAELRRLAAREWALRAAVRELWIRWSAARERAAAEDELADRLGEVASLAAQQEHAGSMSRLDVGVFRVELAGRRADAAQAAARVRALELELRALLGLSPSAAARLTPALAFEAPERDPDALRSRFEHANPELAAVRAAYDAAEQGLRAEVRGQYPDLTIGPGYGSDQGDDRVLLGLSLPLPLWNANRRGVAEARAEREAARGRFEAAYERLAGRLAAACAERDAARAQRELLERTLVPLADEQEAAVRRVAAMGRVDPLLLLESLKMRHDAKVRLVEARAGESLGAVRLAELAGPGTGSTPGPAPADAEGKGR